MHVTRKSSSTILRSWPIAETLLLLLTLTEIGQISPPAIWANSYSDRGPATHQAQDTLEIVLPDTVVPPGSTVWLPVMVSNFAGQFVLGYQFDVQFNASVLLYVGYLNVNTLSENIMITQIVLNDSTVRVGAYSVNPIDGDGVLVKIGFETIGPEMSLTKVNIINPVVGNGTLPVKVIPGNVLIRSTSTNVNSSRRELFPKDFEILRCTPNPFSTKMMIDCQFDVASEVTVIVINIIGRKIKTIFNGMVQPGFARFVWDGRDEHQKLVANSLYLLQFNSPRQQVVLKILKTINN